MAQRVFKTLEEMEAEWLERMPPEKRMRGVPVEERLKGIPVGEYLKAVPVEGRADGLDDEDLKKLRKLVDEKLAAK